MNHRRKSQPIQIGRVTVGGNAPIVVQSMTNTDTRDVMSTIAQIKELEDCGCELVRVAVPDVEAARAVGQALARNPLPIIIPCHRVVSAKGGLGGFSGGVEIKERLLNLEVSTNIG